jgi:hypothetical protein
VGNAGGTTVPIAAGWQAAPVLSLPAGTPSLDSLVDICGWLGTYGERLRMARGDERELAVLHGRLTARYHLRAEPA